VAEAVRRRPTGIARVVLVAVVAWLGLLLVVPLVALAVTVARSLPDVAAQLSTREALHAMALSLAFAVVSIGINSAFGIAGGLVLVRQHFLGRRLLDAFVDLPLALSPVMTGLAFLLVFGRTGVARPVLERLGIDVAFAWPAVLVATLFVTLPFTLREVALVLAEIGDTEEQAAATLGASAWQTFWRVTLPNVWGAVVGGATLTAARALGEFGAVLVVGGAIANRTQTATTFIHGAIEERQEPAAYGMALLLAAASVALLVALHRRKNA
jgi:sulfate transport system permease protein